MQDAFFVVLSVYWFCFWGEILHNQNCEATKISIICHKVPFDHSWTPRYVGMILAHTFSSRHLWRRQKVKIVPQTTYVGNLQTQSEEPTYPR